MTVYMDLFLALFSPLYPSNVSANEYLTAKLIGTDQLPSVFNLYFFNHNRFFFKFELEKTLIL